MGEQGGKKDGHMDSSVPLRSSPSPRMYMCTHRRIGNVYITQNLPTSIEYDPSVVVVYT